MKHAPCPLGPNSTLAQRLCRHEALVRAIVLALAAYTVGRALLIPDSLAARMVGAGGPAALIVTVVFAAVVGLSFIDWLINDLMPDRFSAERLARSRPLSYASLGAGYLIQAMALAGAAGLPEGAWSSIWRYVLFGALCGWLALTSATETHDAL